MLLGKRDFQDSRADVILRYTPDEARMLKSYKELPENIRINDTQILQESDEGLLPLPAVIFLLIPPFRNEDINVEFDVREV